MPRRISLESFSKRETVIAQLRAQPELADALAELIAEARAYSDRDAVRAIAIANGVPPERLRP